LAASAVDEVRDYWPERCGHCGRALPTEGRQEDGPARRHQVAELPVLRAYVVEHRLHRQRCPHCGRGTRAAWPAGVPRIGFGPRLQAVVSLLSSRYRLARREVRDVCEQIFGVRLSVGSVQALCERTSEAVAGPVTAVVEAIRRQPVVHVDETGWSTAGQRRWLWTMAASLGAVFQVQRWRSAEVARGLLGPEFRGVLVSDRWSAYNFYAGRRQWCWAHLQRDFQAFVDRGGPGSRLGRQGVLLVQAVFAAWRWHRDEPAAFARALAPVRRAMEDLLVRGVAHRDPKFSGSCRQLLAGWSALWTLAEVPGVPPTNNAAERALRPAVLWRKGSFGCASEAGERFAERMLTVDATCRRQGRPVLPFLVTAAWAAWTGGPAPSLVPTPLPP
jgi:transposase